MSYDDDHDWDEHDPEGPSPEDLERFDREDDETWEESPSSGPGWWVGVTAAVVLIAFLVAVLR